MSHRVRQSVRAVTKLLIIPLAILLWVPVIVIAREVL